MPVTPPDKPTEQTDALQGEDLDLLRLHAKRRGRLALVVHHREGTVSAPLTPGVSVVVGRRPPSHLTVPSAKLSRTHVRFTLDLQGRILVEDLGSTNGTWIGGRRVERAHITPGNEVLAADALAIVQIAVPEAPVVCSMGTSAEAPIAESQAMRDVIATAERVAASAVPVVLHGETGTGKEVMARLLHARSPRAAKPMVSVNCAAIPAQLVESTLFGHERGAFTGAAERKKGVFEEADGGTVFLDEIGDLSLPAQAALLRVLETGSFARVGSPREVAVDVRVVVATHRDLAGLRDAGQFRADLYYRLSVMVLVLPPLRDHLADIEPLARRFLAKVGGRVRDISPEALGCLCAYAWPGNVRELRNTIERAAILSTGPTIREEDLPACMREAGEVPRASTRTLPPPSDTGESPTLPPGAQGNLRELRATVVEYEAKAIQQMLEATGWNQSEAARRLGMPIRTLSHKAKTLGLKKPY